MQIEASKLYEICFKVLQKNGVPVGQAEIIADSIIYAHRCGKGTHGATRLGIYVSKIRRCGMSADTRLEVISERGVVTVFDANNGFGQVAAHAAIEKGVKLSNIFGVGLVAVRQSNNFGAASYFAQLAVSQGKIVVIFSNSAPAIAPWGGSKPLFGTNPIAYGFPAPEGTAPIILDIAVSIVARGKIRLAAKSGAKIPYGWALDPDGNPTDDPELAILGSMVPIGEHKGSGLALIVDLFAGLLSGAGFAGSVKPLNTQNALSNNGHLFMLIDPTFFMDRKTYYDKICQIVDKTKQSAKKGSVFLPGERSYLRAKATNDTLELTNKVYQEIIDLYNE